MLGEQYEIGFLGTVGEGIMLKKETHEQGVDIKVCHNKYSRYFFIETKGESSAKSAKSKKETVFVYSLGQIITRMKVGSARYYYGLGLLFQVR